MKDRMLLGAGRHMISIPRVLWQRALAANARKVRAAVGFMSEDHHRVRDFAVTELPHTGAPLAPETVARRLGLSQPRVTELLDQMERRMMFLVRNDRGGITWAYPVTVEETPHHASFRTGEEAYAP